MADTQAKPRFKTPPGMKDIFPAEMPVFELIEGTARKVFTNCGYEEIRTPILEVTELFARGIGQATDIVEKEMFTLKEEGLTLRPEGTASVVRAYVEHSMHKDRQFRKFFYTGPFFRRERPQKGRLRQFHQVGIEAIGAGDPLLDAEVIEAASMFLDALGISGCEIHLNSIGCGDCRDAYRAVLKDALADKTAALCENCKNRFDRNVFRILDCKKKGCRDIADSAPSFRERLCEGCSSHLSAVEEALESIGVSFIADPHLVRGFDYYTGTVFEITSGSLGAQNAVAAGGRYDGLVEELGGPSIPAVGFSAGCERIAMLLDHSSIKPARDLTIGIYVVYVRPEQKSAAFSLISQLRRDGVACDINYEDKSMKAQMRAAERSGAPFAAIIGPDEVEKGVVNLKNMADGEQEEVSISELSTKLTPQIK